MEPLLEVQGLTVELEYSGQCTPLLKEVSFTLYRGKTTVLLGPSGSGKSTLASVISGVGPGTLYRVRQGKLIWHHQGEKTDLLQLSAEEHTRLLGKGIGQIFQEPEAALNPVLTIGQQLREVAGDPAAWSGMAHLLQRLGLDAGEVEKRYPWQLSGGQQQRILLAQALSLQPSLLLADEPTGALDRHHQEAFLDILRDFLQSPAQPSMLLITHDRGIARAIGDDVLQLEDGRIHPLPMAGGKPVRTVSSVQADVDATAEVLLELQGFTGGYQKNQPAFRDISAVLRRGQCVGIAGPSGSGKSSLLRGILGLLPWQAGEVSKAGVSMDVAARVRTCALIYQDPGRSLNPTMTVGQAFQEWQEAAQAAPRLSMEDVLAQVQLPPDTLSRLPAMFSGGQRQRIAIARALFSGRQVLLCDEPFSSVDEPLQEEIMALIAGLCRRNRMGAIVVAHDVGRLADYCDHLLLMRDGQVYWSGKPDAFSLQDDGFITTLLSRPGMP